MSAQAGILYRDDRPVPAEVLDTLSRFNRVLAPHREGRYVGDGVALMSFALHFDHLATQETQPIHRPDGSVLTWDGRLDNRNDFLVRLHHDLEGPATDAALIALAMQKWPEDTPDRIVGDWSLARWDAVSRELVLARDYVGNRPLYYCCRPDYFVWSTSDDALVVICDLVGKLNERRLVGHIVGPHPPCETWYEGLLCVPSGCCLSVTPTLCPRISPFFTFSSTTTRFTHNREYGDRYRELLTEAIQVRLRSHTSVWTELSGGYDSSAVTCIASSLVSARAVEAPGLQLMSRVMPDSPESDESYYIESVERWCRRQSFRERVDSGYSFSLPSFEAESAGGRRGSQPYVEPAEAAGSHVLLTGVFGDAVAGDQSPAFVLLDRLMSRGVAAFVKDSVAHCRYERSLILPLWWSVFRAAVSPARVGYISAASGLASRARSRRLSPKSSASQIFGLRDDLLRRATPPPRTDTGGIANLPPSTRDIARAIEHFASYNMLSALYVPSQLRRTHPYSHRPLVTFMLSVPPSAFASYAGSRSFVRAALADALPPSILNRLNKGYASPVASRIYRRAAMDALETGALLQWDLVVGQYADPHILRDILTSFVDGSQSTSMLVTGLFEAETMLRLTRRPPETTASRRMSADVA